MVLPIVVYGDPVLRKIAQDIDKNYEGLDQLIKDMFDTMYRAKGVGLAAPQVGKAIRLFIVDTEPFAEDDEDDEDDEHDGAQLVVHVGPLPGALAQSQPEQQFPAQPA